VAIQRNLIVIIINYNINNDNGDLVTYYKSSICRIINSCMSYVNFNIVVYLRLLDANIGTSLMFAPVAKE
jgi:hypothetical protein